MDFEQLTLKGIRYNSLKISKPDDKHVVFVVTDDCGVYLSMIILDKEQIEELISFVGK